MLRVKRWDRDEEIEWRQKVAEYYLAHIDNPDIQLREVGNRESHVWHLFVARSSQWDELQQYWSEQGVRTLIHYPLPPHKQQAYMAFSDTGLSMTEEIHLSVLSLPLGPNLPPEQTSRVVEETNLVQ